MKIEIDFDGVAARSWSIDGSFCRIDLTFKGQQHNIKYCRYSNLDRVGTEQGNLEIKIFFSTFTPSQNDELEFIINHNRSNLLDTFNIKWLYFFCKCFFIPLSIDVDNQSQFALIHH